MDRGRAKQRALRIVNTVKVGGLGGFDYINADVEGRRLYIPRRGDGARVTVFDLDTLNPPVPFPTSTDTVRWSIRRPITPLPQVSPS